MRSRLTKKGTSWIDVGIIGILRKNAIVTSLAVLVLTIVGINALAPHSLPDDPLEAAFRLQRIGMHDRAAQVLEGPVANLQNNDPASLDLTYYHILSHFEAYPSDSGSGIMRIYETLAAEPSAVADVGRYGQGLISSFVAQYDDALAFFEQVSNRDQKYLNNSLGYVHWELGNDEQAEAYFWREIELGGNVPRAVLNLSKLYLQAGRFEDARELIEDDRTGPYVPNPARGELALRTGRIGRYLFVTLLLSWQYVQIDAVLVSLVICATWFIYLWRIDIFEQEPLRFTLGALALGGLSLGLVRILIGPVLLVSPFSLGDDKWSELLHYVLHPGLLEELAKSALVLVAFWLFRQVDEPLDMVIYGSLIALGFATMENLEYLAGQGLGAGFTRFMISTVVHMSLTGSICYIWAWMRYIKKRSPVLPVLLCLAIAVLLHGLFNFAIANWGQYPFSWLVYIGFVLFFSISYGQMLRRSLYHSPFRIVYSARSYRLKNHSLLFSVALFLALVGFLQDNFVCATEVANVRLYAPFTPPSFTHLLGMIVLGVLGRLEVKEPIKLSASLERRRRSRRRRR